MDGCGHFLLEQLRSCCKQRIDACWVLLAAAGDNRCIQQNYNTLASYTWQYVAPESPICAQGRVLALSISRAGLLRKLLAGWERDPNANNFENSNNCTDLIYIAGHTARNFLETQELNPTAEPWSWSAYGSKILTPDNLINRLLKETVLTLTDIQKSVAVGGSALKALRTQAVKIESRVFEYYSQLIDATDYYVTKLLIELSRKTEFKAEMLDRKCSERLSKN